MDTIVYENCEGETINLNSATIKSDFYDTLKFSFQEKDGYILDEGKDFSLKVVCVNKTVANELFTILQKSSRPDQNNIRKRTYVGTDKLYVNGWYILCRLTGVSRVMHDKDNGVKLEINFHATQSCWYYGTENYNSLGSTGSGTIDLSDIDSANWALIFTNSVAYEGQSVGIGWYFSCSFASDKNKYTKALSGTISPNETLSKITFAYSGWLDAYQTTANGQSKNYFGNVRNKPNIVGGVYDYTWSFNLNTSGASYNPIFAGKIYLEKTSLIRV